MRIGAAYIRVSTDDQIEYSPDAQLREIRKRAEADDVAIMPEFIFMDEGISGRTTRKRSAFNEMIGIAKSTPRPFDLIYVWKFSRFARNQEESIVYKNMLRKIGIAVTSVSEPIGDDAFGSLIERIIEWMDEYYSINLSGEVTRGMTEKALRGELQTIASFGYDKKPDQPMVINPIEAKHVHYIFTEYLSGASMFAIAARLNEMGVRTKKGNQFEVRQIEYMLNNPVYKGYVRWTPDGKTVSRRIYDSPNTKVVKSTHPAIIDEETWNRAQEKYLDEKRKRKKGERPAENKRHYLSGILKCGTCGSSLSYSQATRGFQCIGYAHGACKPSHYISASKIEAALLKALEELSQPGIYIENNGVIEERTHEHELPAAQIKNLEKMSARAREAYLTGLDTIDEYSRNKTKIQVEIDALKTRIKLMKNKSVHHIHMSRQQLTIISILQNNTKTSVQKQNALHQIIEKIEFSRPEEALTIYFYK